MKRLVHLRGTMATGKTSTARSVIARGNYEERCIKVAGKEYPYNYDPAKKIVVTGSYGSAACGGLDGKIEDRNLMLAYLAAIMRRVRPETIVFEAVMYGLSFKFGKECDEMCRGLGYEYVGILLAPSLQDVFENMSKRNGGKPINYKGLSDKYFNSLRAAEKLKDAGVKIVTENTRAYAVDELYKIVEKWL